MEDLRKLEKEIGKELGKIREKKVKTASDRYRYAQLQKDMIKVYDVTIMINEMKQKKLIERY